jgi:antitoxin FitA
MATVQIRNLDESAYDVLRLRAAASGRSLQEYVRLQLEESAKTATVSELLGDIRQHLETAVPMADIVAAQHEGRDR